MVSRPPNAQVNRQSREDHFALKGTCQTFAFNFIFYVSFADKVAVWLQIHAAEASLCCLRSQVSVLQNSIPFLIAELFRDFKNCVIFVTRLCSRFFSDSQTTLYPMMLHSYEGIKADVGGTLQCYFLHLNTSNSVGFTVFLHLNET